MNPEDRYDDDYDYNDNYEDQDDAPDSPPSKPSSKPTNQAPRLPMRDSAQPSRSASGGSKRAAGKMTDRPTNRPDKAKSGKSAKGKPKPKERKKVAPVPRGKWSGGTGAERIQRLRWIGTHLYRWVPYLLVIAILLAIFIPPMLRNLQPAPIIAPFFTREVQYWAPKIQQWSVQYDVNPNLAATLMQIESCGLPGAASSVGAQGLFQVMPFHFDESENMTDPETNAKRGIGVIRECLGYSNGDVGLAMACYNGGPSLIYRDSSTWPAESQRYYTWGTGIYDDAIRGKSRSESLTNWLAAGGVGLCEQAAVALNLPTREPEALRPPQDQQQPLPTAVLATFAPQSTPSGPTATFQRFTPLAPGDLPTFALYPTITKAPE
jgi:hypothetical protein